MMNEQVIFEELQIQAEDLFRQATLEEFFGNHLFDPQERDYYLFSPEETGNAVWIIEHRSKDQGYEIIQVEERRKFHPNPAIPRSCPFNHCESINDTWFEDRRIKDIETKLKQGGRFLAQKANKAVTEVLMTAISDENKIHVQEQKLHEILADIFSRLVNDGFRPNTFLFPEHLEAKLVQQGIIVRDNQLQNTHYVGKTISGQHAFWSSDLPPGTALIFDNKISMLLSKKPEFHIVKLGPFTPGVCGYLSLNPVIKNTKGIIAIEGIEQSLSIRMKDITTKQVAGTMQYIDPNRIDELRAITSTKFDLMKLIKLCEELNACCANECYLAVVMLLRAIVDHVPPIFGYRTFIEVANSYGGKSLKKSLQNLQNSSRNIADAYLHIPIRNKETLPNRTQVNFSNDLDVLLAEVVRILK